MRGHTRTATRIAAYVASGALALSGAVVALAPADAVTHDPIGANEGATWLADELDHGLIYNPNFGGFNDYGLTLDVGFSLNAVGGHAADVQSIKNAMAGHVNDYVTPFGGPHSYTGGLAKLAAFLGSPAASSFGGQNLITQLEGRVATAAPITGRIQDTGYTPGSDFDDDTANTLGQSYAARALTKAGSSRASAVTAFLLQQQCPNGGFRLYFTADRGAINQSCTDNALAETDATAIALQQLNEIPTTVALTAAKSRASSFLVGKQKADGSWGGGTATEASNANSTGLATAALAGTTDSEQGAQWLRSRQVSGYNACDRLSTQRGAFAYDNAVFAAGRSHGITKDTQDQWRRASAQALLGAAYLPVDATPSDPALAVPSGFLKAGTHQVIRTTGVRTGDALCLTGPGTALKGAATGSTWSKTVTLPAGTGARRYTVRDRAGHVDGATLKVLGKKKLTLHRSKYAVKRSHVVHITIVGLQPGEIGRITYRGKTVRHGAASAKGTLGASFHVGTSLGKKTVKGYGQFTDIRKGTKVIKVVR